LDGGKTGTPTNENKQKPVKATKTKPASISKNDKSTWWTATVQQRRELYNELSQTTTRNQFEALAKRYEERIHKLESQ